MATLKINGAVLEHGEMDEHLSMTWKPARRFGCTSCPSCGTFLWCFSLFIGCRPQAGACAVPCLGRTSGNNAVYHQYVRAAGIAEIVVHRAADFDSRNEI